MRDTGHFREGRDGPHAWCSCALEAIVTALSVVNSVVPPTVGFAEADPECAVRISAEPVRDYPQKVALSNSLGFGGHNASVAISPYVE